MVRMTNPATPTRTSCTLSSVEENSGDGVLALSCGVDQDVETHVILDQTSAQCSWLLLSKNTGYPLLTWASPSCIGISIA